MPTSLSALLLSCLLFISACKRPPFQINTTPFENALKEARQEKKMMVAIITTKGCDACERLKKGMTVLTEREMYPDKFLFYEFSADSIQNAWIELCYYDKSYPISCVFSPEGQLITIVKGAQASNLSSTLKNISDNKTEQIYEWATNDSPVKGKNLVDVLRVVFDAYRFATNTNDTLNRQQKLRSHLRALEGSLKIQSYFFNNYLLSKLNTQSGDTAAAKRYANEALHFNQIPDLMIYPAQRSQMKFVADSSFSQQNAPLLACRDTDYDFGTVSNVNSMEATFIFKNAGNKPLKIEQIVVSCSCLSVNYDKNPILPGAQSAIKVKFDIRHAGKFAQSLYVISNAFESPVYLKIKGQVV
jgi:Protein of unknown function (DUF1573)